jgi:hypothetical protein
VGGQAVNFWAEYYQRQEPALAQYAPFTSQDIDFLGDRRTVEECARRLGVEARLEDPFAVGPSAGLLSFEDRDGERHPIDFLRVLCGVVGDDLDEMKRTAVPVDVPGSGPASLRVMNPLWCLTSRVHNVVLLPGTYDTPHGLWQLAASILCAREFLGGLLAAGREREALKSIRQIYELCLSHGGLLLRARKQIDPFEATLNGLSLPEKFIEHDLPRKREWLAGKRQP